MAKKRWLMVSSWFGSLAIVAGTMICAVSCAGKLNNPVHSDQQTPKTNHSSNGNQTISQIPVVNLLPDIAQALNKANLTIPKADGKISLNSQNAVNTVNQIVQAILPTLMIIDNANKGFLTKSQIQSISVVNLQPAQQSGIGTFQISADDSICNIAIRISGFAIIPVTVQITTKNNCVFDNNNLPIVAATISGSTPNLITNCVWNVFPENNLSLAQQVPATVSGNKISATLTNIVQNLGNCQQNGYGVYSANLTYDYDAQSFQTPTINFLFCSQSTSNLIVAQVNGNISNPNITAGQTVTLLPWVAISSVTDAESQATYQWETLVGGYWSELNNDTDTITITPEIAQMTTYRLATTTGNQTTYSNAVTVQVNQVGQVTIGVQYTNSQGKTVTNCPENNYEQINLSGNQQINLFLDNVNSLLNDPSWTYQWESSQTSLIKTPLGSSPPWAYGTWQKINGGNTANLTVPASEQGYAVSYRLVLTNQENTNQQIFSNIININNPAVLGSVQLIAKNATVNHNGVVSQPAAGEPLTLSVNLLGGNIQSNNPNIVYEWMYSVNGSAMLPLQTGNGLLPKNEQINSNSSQINVLTQQYQLCEFQVVVRMLDNWAVQPVKSNILDVQAQITPAEKEAAKQNLQDYLQKNTQELWSSWANSLNAGGGISTIISLMSTYQSYYMIRQFTNQDFGSVSVTTVNGYLCLTTKFLTDKYLQNYATVTKYGINIPAGTILKMILPYQENNGQVTINSAGQGAVVYQPMSQLENGKNKKQNCSIFVVRSADGKNEYKFNKKIQRNLTTPFGFQLFGVDGKTLFQKQDLQYLSGYAEFKTANNTPVIPFTTFPNWWQANGTLLITPQNSSLPVPLGNKITPTINWNRSQPAEWNLLTTNYGQVSLSVNPEIMGLLYQPVFTYQWYYSVQLSKKTLVQAQPILGASQNVLTLDSLPRDLIKPLAQFQIWCEITYSTAGVQAAASSINQPFIVNISNGSVN